MFFFSLQNVLCRVAIDQSLQVLSLRKDRDGHSAISFSDATQRCKMYAALMLLERLMYTQQVSTSQRQRWIFCYKFSDATQRSKCMRR